MSRFSKADEAFMKRALALAQKNKSRKHADPKVGAVFVKDNQIIGEGYYDPKKSKKHAEIVAFDAIQKDLPKKDLTLYLTMEPCTVYKRTGSCTDHLLLNKESIKRIVIADKDYNPDVNGFSIELLKKHAIQVDFGLMQGVVQRMNKNFNAWTRKQKYQKPFVRISVATSLDGKIADKDPKTEDKISTKKDFQVKDGIRAHVDAVIVGGNTFKLDDPSLQIKKPVLRKKTFQKKGYVSPIKVVVIDKIDRTQNMNGAFFDDSKTGPTRKLFFTTKKTEPEIIKKIRDNSPLNEIFVFPKTGVALPEILRILSYFGVESVLVEGGGAINFAFVKEGLVDEIEFHMRSILLGGKNAVSSLMGEGFTIKDAQKVYLKDIVAVDSETIVLRYSFNK